MNGMEIVLLLFFFLASVFCLFFSSQKKYYQRTVLDQGEAAANRLFKQIKVGGYVLGTVFLLYLVLVIFT
jgi:hypothetical protein